MSQTSYITGPILSGKFYYEIRKAEEDMVERAFNFSQHTQTPESQNAGQAAAPSTKWEPTPWWMFWRPSMRRFRGYGQIGRTSVPNSRKLLYEYQHIAFVAREALENHCAPRTFAGAETQQGPTQASANYIAGRLTPHGVLRRPDTDYRGIT